MLFDRKKVVRLQGDYIPNLPVVLKSNRAVTLTFDFGNCPLPDALFLSVKSSSSAPSLALDRLLWSMVILEK